MNKAICAISIAGAAALMLSLVLFGLMVVLKYCHDISFIETPLPLLVAMFLMTGVQLILMSLVAEISTRTYHESKGKPL